MYKITSGCTFRYIPKISNGKGNLMIISYQSTVSYILYYKKSKMNKILSKYIEM